MHQVVECVPNFSEGRDQKVIDAIATAIRDTVGCTLLDVDPGASTNRTVYTFVGDPEAVVKGALNGAKAAHRLIDMAVHKGEHPRLGAMDVCPFIPVRDITVAECVSCAKQLGHLLASELDVPVYLYGAASSRDYRKTVAQIRAGEYEALATRIKTAEWEPDFGPSNFVPQWGATMVGVRQFLIAYNVNLIATKEQAHRIALNIRERGRGKSEPGRLPAVQGMGWWLEEANMAQVSLNLTDHDVTPIHLAYEEVCKDAAALSLPVVGSEIVGLVPLRALLQVAEFYIKRDGLLVLEEGQKVRLAISKLGLSSLKPFVPK
ncbi:Formimidoyltransferase-cyclodeaminase [Cryptotermes secundus]|nr:Formimidoyltransferase-cyclodeaminase [Cryptotermes secundus]